MTDPVERPKLALEPRSSSSYIRARYLRLLVLGPPKAGKTTTAVVTSPGPVLVWNSDQPDGLDPAVSWIEDHNLNQEFLYNRVRSIKDIEAAFASIHTLIKANKVKTLVWDTITGFSDVLSESCLAAFPGNNGVSDGRKAWPEYHRRLADYVQRLRCLPCHVVVTAHFEEWMTDDAKDKNVKAPKVGQGIVPCLFGKSRQRIGGLFSDVVFLDQSEPRSFITSIKGVWGPGCRHLTPDNSKGVSVVKADIKQLIGKFNLDK